MGKNRAYLSNYLILCHRFSQFIVNLKVSSKNLQKKTIIVIGAYALNFTSNENNDGENTKDFKRQKETEGNLDTQSKQGR